MLRMWRGYVQASGPTPVRALLQHQDCPRPLAMRAGSLECNVHTCLARVWSRNGCPTSLACCIDLALGMPWGSVQGGDAPANPLALQQTTQKRPLPMLTACPPVTESCVWRASHGSANPTCSRFPMLRMWRGYVLASGPTLVRALLQHQDNIFALGAGSLECNVHTRMEPQRLPYQPCLLHRPGPWDALG